MDTYCDAWHTSSSDRYGLGSPLTNGQILEQRRYSCENAFALLCVEISTEPMSKRRRRSLDDDDEIEDDNDDNDFDDDSDEIEDKLLTEAEYAEQLKLVVSQY